jgi:hypothetical protein
MVDNMVAFFYLGESTSGVHAPKMLDSLPTRSREIILTNMKQSVSLTWDSEVSIASVQLRRGGWRPRGDLQWWRSFEAHQGLCCDGGTHYRYAWSRYVPRVDYGVIILSTWVSFLHATILSWMECFLCLIKVCHARALDSSWCGHQHQRYIHTYT